MYITYRFLIDLFSPIGHFIPDQFSNVFYHHSVLIKVPGSKQSQALEESDTVYDKPLTLNWVLQALQEYLTYMQLIVFLKCNLSQAGTHSGERPNV